MGKVKLFVDAHVFDGEYQGTRTFIKGLYNALGETNYPIESYLCSATPQILEEEFQGVKNTHFLKYQARNPYSRLGYEIPLLIRKHRFDYAHFQYVTPIIKNCKFVVTTHDLLFNEFPDKFPLSYRLKNNILFKRSAKMADVLTTVSAYSRQSIHQFYQIPLDAIHVIPNGISPVFFNGYDAAKSKQYILEKYNIADYLLYVSRIEPRKNHASLLEAYLKLELWKQAIHLVFVGKTTIESEKLSHLLRRIQPEQRDFIHFIETVNNHDLVEFYRASRLFVYPSEAEGFGIPPLEAAALGIPTLCSNTTAMSDFVFLGSNLFDPYNVVEIMNKITYLLNNEVQSESQINKVIQKRYNWRNIAELFANLLEQDAHRTP